MKPIIYKVSPASESSFNIREVRLPYFDATWHFHEEFELVLIRQSSGKRLIGNHISNYEPGNLCFLGPGLPHLYRCDETYCKAGENTNAVSIVIQFSEQFLGEPFFNTPEMEITRRIMEKALLGLHIYGDSRNLIATKMVEMLDLRGLEKLIHLLSIFNILTHTKEYVALSKPGSIANSIKDTERMNVIYDYVLQNYRKTVSLKEVAKRVNMSTSAFCRYFKLRTKKNFLLFVTEMRISHSCKLLLEGDVTIALISVKSGFNNVSNFNRHFKLITGTSPLKYKQECND